MQKGLKDIFGGMDELSSIFGIFSKYSGKLKIEMELNCI